MKKSQSRRTRLPLFILFANMDTSHFEVTMLEQAKASKSENFIERIRNDTRKLPEACLMLKSLLDTIIAEGKVTDSEELRYFLRVANEFQTEYRLQNGKIIEECRPGTHWVLYPLWLRGLSLNVVRFLQSEKNIRKIRRCAWCEIYFVALRADKRFKYCPKCSEKDKKTAAQKTASQQRWRAKEQEKIARKKRAKQLARMIAAGYSPEEAEAELEVMELADKEI